MMDAAMDFGMIGMAVMGSNLALNLADHGIRTACYNYTSDLTEAFVKEHPHENIQPYYELREFVHALKRPRKIMMMIMAGAPVDETIKALIPLLEQGDILIDGGNTYFSDTVRRHDLLKKHGIHFFGVGVSGGETGARRGPSLMAGGDKDAYTHIAPMLEAISAKAEDGAPCCAYMGADGAGHYVKMVHNGIEYADMQLIAEAYLLLKHAGGYSNAQMAGIFSEWNDGELRSFLIGITADILRERDDLSDSNLVDQIEDRAGQKGTGRWTSMEALREGVDLSLITAACNARVLSNCTAEREALNGELPVEQIPYDSSACFIEMVRRSLYIGKLIAYTQGFSLYRAAADAYGWDFDYAGIAGIFRAGCIIQADLLIHIMDAYRKDPNLPLILLDDFFLAKMREYVTDLQAAAVKAVEHSVSAPALLSAVSYVAMLRAPQVGANLIQAQRDYFGAHTYQRNDRPGTFHHHWPHDDVV